MKQTSPEMERTDYSEPLEDFIWNRVKDEPDTQIRRKIYAYFRANDESDKFPILGKFNATEKAINRLRKFERQAGALSPLEIIYFIENQISEIVNDF